MNRRYDSSDSQSVTLTSYKSRTFPRETNLSVSVSGRDVSVTISISCNFGTDGIASFAFALTRRKEKKGEKDVYAALRSAGSLRR